MDDTAVAARVGDMVVYTDSKGHEKPALVVGTPQSWAPGQEGELPGPGAGEAHLRVFSVSACYTRLAVPWSDVPLDGSPSWRGR